MEHDTLSFCHPPGAAGWLVGFLQFLAWFVTPSLLFAPERDAAAGDVFVRLVFWAAKALALLAIVAQTHIHEPVPDPACRDVLGTEHGLPSVSAVLAGFYAALLLMCAHARWAHFGVGGGAGRTARMLGVLAAVLAGLYLNSLNTLRQLALSLAAGAAAAVLFVLLLDDVFVPYLLPHVLLDACGLGAALGTRSRFAPCAAADRAPPPC